jgi:N-carbamoylputrescine amidase
MMKGHVKYTFDPKENARFRAAWGLFRDRRPDLYEEIVA